MQTVYRINTIAGFKPWRSSGPYFITDKNAFDKIRALEDGGDFYSIPAPEGVNPEEFETLADWLYEQPGACCVKPPYILAGEVTFYTE